MSTVIKRLVPKVYTGASFDIGHIAANPSSVHTSTIPDAA